MYLYRKRIKCLSCSKNFRGITERGVKRYICGGYHNYRICTRKKIDESFIVELVENHKQIQKNRPEFYNVFHVEQDEKEYVDRITFNPDTNELTIYFIDGTKTYFSDTQQTYWALG